MRGKRCYDPQVLGGLSALPSYRLYRLDGARKIITADWIEAESDQHALEEAKNRAVEGPHELWERGRLVARLP
jgi:hypothetical protein